MYYDGANWQWDRYDEVVKEYGKKLNHKGDEMNLRFIERDGKKILQQEVLEEYGSHWEDVPCVEENKEQRKLWEILKKEYPFSDPSILNKQIFYANLSVTAIDAVIECYSQWSKINSGPTLKSFPEYLKEKLGNE